MKVIDQAGSVFVRKIEIRRNKISISVNINA